MRTVHIKRAEEIFKACFGESHVLKHKEYLVNAVTDGKPSAGAWYDSYCDLMDERMVYGSLIFDSGATDGTETIPNRLSITCAQLSLFRLFPLFRQRTRERAWLMNVVSAVNFAFISEAGNCSYNNASIAGGVRPYAPIY